MAAVLCAGLTGCSEDRLAGVCDVVLDGSGSSEPKTGFDAEQRVRAQLPRQLFQAGCRTVTFEPITGASRSAYCTADDVDLDPDAAGNLDRPALRNTRRGLAVQRAGELLGCVRTDQREVPGSDVLGGLWRAAEERPTGGAGYHLIVFSDFMATDPKGGDHPLNLYEDDLSTPEKRRAIIERLAADKRIPNLSGVRLVTIGYGTLQGRDPVAFPAFDAFWKELLKDKAHCPVEPKKV
ncbi:hypothetical protein [Nonomuraea monospora]|uniref:hypothetical protein n=1 Tax=Nonomuraea monospora TaxID=568818 RepID=UPI0031E25857